jgi:hypothetical protein
MKTQPDFKQIPFEELAPSDLVLLDKILRMEHTGYSLADVLVLLLDSRAHLWRLSGEGCEGIVVTKIVPFPDGRKEFNAWLVCGRGMMRYGAGMWARLLAEAKAAGCSTVVTSTARPGLVEHYKKHLPSARVYHTFEQEI